jgi:excisionase family DNA binding protein
MKHDEDLDELLTYEQLAQITQKSVVTLRRYTMLGTGPKALRLGRHVRFRRSDVKAWLDEHIVEHPRNKAGR